MSDATKKTIDEQILERLQALEVLLMEQRKEIDTLKESLKAKQNKDIVYGITPSVVLQ